MIEKITIGAYEYTVETVQNLHGKAHDPLYGEIDHSALKIRIDADYTDHQRTQAILWHEILHGLIELAGIEHTNKIERLVQVLGVGVADVLAKNPEMRR